MAVKIKLKRIGKMHEPHYRIVVADARTARDGRAIEEIGQYHPVENPSRIQVDSERAQYWLGVGAQPTEAVRAIFRVTGDWQAFKGEPAPPAMLVAEPKPDKKALFEAAAKEAAGINEKAATTPRAKKKVATKADESTDKSIDAPAEPAPAEPAPAEPAPAEPAPAEPAPAEPAPAEPAPAEPAPAEPAPAESA
ncbi:MAG: 30S ribosomal protein S16, partial [Actinomycetia bacterium]|nr:30S ribosomal protein S16 [Actinomycetes bacterium]